MQKKPIKSLCVRVKDRHIRAGEQGECDSCAVALALKEQTGCTYAEVQGDGRVLLDFPDEDGVVLVHGWLSAKGVNFVQAFDESKRSVKPCVLSVAFNQPVTL